MRDLPPDIFRLLQSARDTASTKPKAEEYSGLLAKLSGRDFDLIRDAIAAAAKPEASDELIAKGRELLALREKATPGPWLIRWKSNSLHKPPPPGTPYQFGDFILNIGSDEGGEKEAIDTEFIASAPDMADWIAAAMVMLEVKPSATGEGS